MNKIIITVLGKDRPGILSAISDILFKQNCNIENISQTILQSEFAGILIASIPDGLSIKALDKSLKAGLSPLDLHVHVKHLEPGQTDQDAEDQEHFVITTIGPDAKGLVAGITAVIARHGVNISRLKAVFKGGKNPDNNVMIYEVDVACRIDRQALNTDLRKTAEDLGLEINIQHRNIFEVINRI
jgi:glycine cleavage system transcriptional repressor